MTTLRYGRLQKFVIYTIVLSVLCPPSVMADQPAVLRLFGKRRQETTSVDRLARKLDDLEHHIDEYGSVVVKTPDVWGESRLMRHRDDVEQQLKARLNTFRFRINALQTTRDAAFLAQAIALQERISTGDVPALTGTTPTGNDQSNVTGAVAGLTTTASAIEGSNTSILPRRGFAASGVQIEGQPSGTLNVGIEPVIELDQLNRYLQHLNELRRLNEGDDTADSPGYALNLIRIPVSVLPGRRTQKGYGAEVEITIDPYLSDELLPLAFRDFVINGVRNRISLETFEIASRIDIDALRSVLQDYYSGKEADDTESNTAKFETLLQIATEDLPPAYQGLGMTPLQAREAFQSINEAIQNAERENQFEIEIDDVDNDDAKRVLNRILLLQESETDSDILGKAPAQDDLSAIEHNRSALQHSVDAGRSLVPVSHSSARMARKISVSLAKDNAVDSFLDTLRPLYEKANPRADSRRDRMALSPSYLDSVNGHTLFVVAEHLYRQLVLPGLSGSGNPTQVKPEDRLLNGLTYPAAEKLIETELRAAYDFLSLDSTQMLWQQYCTTELARAIKEHRRRLSNGQREHLADLYKAGLDAKQNDPNFVADVEVDPTLGVHTIREQYFADIQRYFPQAKGSVTASLAWQIILESALLNERLVDDMREIASTRNCPCVIRDWQAYFGPNPSYEARHAFKEYVRCRWPIHVFSLDPVTQDQNVADTFSRRREMQLVLALAASNRLIGMQSLSRFVRRMEYDLETISLNRTAVAFSHGDNAFGWRFFPRIQAPPVKSNVNAAFHDLLIGGPDREADLREHKLEPGIRECTALVVMPSFLPQVTVDVRTNWFRLAEHKPIRHFMHRNPGFEDSVELSREVAEMRQLARQCSEDSHLYRSGEVFRLCKAVERLDRRLPLQTHSVQVPWENELGGFEMFSTGASVLGPELLGWYGAPGIIVEDVKALRNATAIVMQERKTLNEAELRLRTAQLAGSGADVIATLTAERDEARTKLAAAQELASQVALSTTSTDLFLVGKNFSVLDTQVIAGGVDITDSVRLLSRNLMAVRVPSTVSTILLDRHRNTAPGRQHVAVNLMTPYGAAGNQLLIPVVPGSFVSTPQDLIQRIDNAKKAADTAQAAATAAQSKADLAVARINAEAPPVNLLWKAQKKTFELSIAWDNSGNPVPQHFNPAVDAIEKIEIVEGPDNGGWPATPKPIVAGQFAAWVEVTGSSKKLPVGPWDLDPAAAPGAIDGKLNNAGFSAEELLQEILNSLQGQIKVADEVELEVEGFIRFHQSQPVIQIQDSVEFTLKVRKTEEAEPNQALFRIPTRS
jgi:hypothetical protein